MVRKYPTGGVQYESTNPRADPAPQTWPAL